MIHRRPGSRPGRRWIMAKRRGCHVPDFMRPDGNDRIWHSGWALSGAAGRHDHHVSIFHLQRLSPASDAGGRNRNGYDSSESALSGGEKGYRDANEGYVAAELRKAGFATLTYDSFAARGTTGEAMSATPGYLPAGVTDAFAALRQLSSEPRIDVNRIAILGFSFGAEVAHLTAIEPLRSVLDPGPARFAAHVAFYPALNFGVVADRGAYTGSPVLMLLGGKDENLPAAKVESYLAYLRVTGNPAPIETVTYPGAYHAWTVPGVVPARFFPELVSAKKCPLILLGPNRLMFLIDAQVRPFDPDFFGGCMKEAPGYSVGFDAAVRAQSIADAGRFLQRNLQP
jgi:dienelactone hydrolase